MKYLLGIDIGTSGTKTVLFDESGIPQAKTTIEYPMRQPRNGWAEQDPDDWWNAVASGIKAVLAAEPHIAEDIAAIGLSGQMHGLVMLDKHGKVLRPSIIWCDQRTGAECEQMKNIVGEKRILEITANPPMTGFTASKILWVQNNEPDIYAKCAHILLPKDYIRYKLTGEYATEVSDASGMQLMDVAGRCWSGEILEKLHIDRALLGAMHESPDVTGTVHKEASDATGIIVGTPVVGGAGDNPAAAIGTGIVKEGSAFTSIGTSAVIYAVSDEPRIDMKGRVHSLCASVPGKWTVMSCTQAAGLSLRWLRDTCCVPEIEKSAEQGIDPYEIMTSMASNISPGSLGLIFLPYLMGERSPHPDPNCRGVFFGLSAIHGREHMIRAVMEGVAFSQLECVEVFREMGVPVSDMTATGGGARSALWRKMLADLYGCPVTGLSSDEGGALGAALLAGVGAGVYASVEQAADICVAKTAAMENDDSMHRQYMPYYDLYKRLYKVLKPEFGSLATLTC
ncbi:MAG: xylulokinase [Oscillospiraceae bacterium]|nr:xylulokinase [Oscillospiraceae bacterium]